MELGGVAMKRLLPLTLIAASLTTTVNSIPSHSATPMKRYIVKVDPAFRTLLENSLVRSGGKVSERFSNIFSGFVIELPGIPVFSQSLSRRISFIEEDAPVRLMQTTQSGPTWALDRIDQRALPLSGSFSYTNGGLGSTIYIVDSGIADNDDFGERVSSVGFTSISDGLGFRDCNGHGTHVASLAAGRTYGVAKNSTLVSARVFDCTGSTYTSDVISALNWILGGSNTNSKVRAVVNMSLGGNASASLDAAVASVVDAGIPVVVAAGNDNLNSCNYSPSREPKAITVGATASNDSKAWFSNWGTCIDVNAPGVSILGADTPTATSTTTKSGTSMSAPLVAGAIANYFGFEPSATTAMVNEYITQKSTKNAIAGLINSTTNRLLFAPPDDNPVSVSTSSILNRSESTTITFNAGQSGTARFIANGRTISRCSSVPTNSEVATCTWRPSRHGNNVLTVSLTPSGTSISTTTRKSISVSVLRRASR